MRGLTICNGMTRDGAGIRGGRRLYGPHSCATIENNVIAANKSRSFYVPEPYAGGIAFCDGIIRNNIISGNTGGAVYACHGTVVKNVIEDNRGRRSGGGLAYCGGTIAGNSISRNYARGGGGLSYCPGTIENNNISDNSSGSEGGGLAYCSGVVRDNIITQNSAGYYGGGLAKCSGLIEGNLITGNRAGGESQAGFGGGLYRCGGTIRKNRISGNRAEGDQYGFALGAGGGIYHSGGTLQNNIISGNYTDGDGGGICSYVDVMEQNTIVANRAGRGGGLSDCIYTVRGCIIWGNSAETAEPQVHESSVPSFSCIQDWTGGGEGNIPDDPGFVDFDGPDNDSQTDEDNDYHLLPYSPCIDAGNNQSWMWSATDLDGNPRIVYGFASRTVDIGAYEYPIWAFKVVGMASSGPGTLELTWIGRPGQTYVIFLSLDLLAGVWKPVATVQSTSPMSSWTDIEAKSTQKFYRIEMK